jgi:hypothetical protein
MISLIIATILATGTMSSLLIIPRVFKDLSILDPENPILKTKIICTLMFIWTFMIRPYKMIFVIFNNELLETFIRSMVIGAMA